MEETGETGVNKPGGIRVDRRGFLKLAAEIGAGGAANLVSKKIPRELIREEAVEPLSEQLPIFSDLTRVRFFVEEHPEHLGGQKRAEVLQEILNYRTCEFLAQRHWGISLAMIELNPETAQVLKNINKTFPELPITAWIVLEDAEGYWTTKFNVPSTRKRVEELKSWVDRFDLKIEAIGFDLEPPLAAAKAASALHVTEVARQIIEMERKFREYEVAGYSPEKEMEDLVNQLRHEKIPTESYEMPKPFDSPIIGVLQTKDFDRRLTMVYTTDLPRFSQRHMINWWLKPGTYPGIGAFSSTGRPTGRDFGGIPKLHGKEELERDVVELAAKGVREKRDILKNLYVFALTDLRVAMWTAEALEKAQTRTGTGLKVEEF